MKIVEITEILGEGKVKIKDMVGRESISFTDKPFSRGDYVVMVSGVIVTKTSKPDITVHNV